MKRLGDGQPPSALEDGAQDRGIVGNIPLPPGHELDGTGPLDFMIVLALNPLAGADIGALQQAVEQERVIVRLAKHRFVQPSGRRRLPVSVEFPLWKGFLEEAEIKAGTRLPGIGQVQPTVRPVAPDHGTLHLVLL